MRDVYRLTPLWLIKRVRQGGRGRREKRGIFLSGGLNGI